MGPSLQASVAAASVSACSVPSAITIAVLAAQDHHHNNNSSMGMNNITFETATTAILKTKAGDSCLGCRSIFVGPCLLDDRFQVRLLAIVLAVTDHGGRKLVAASTVFVMVLDRSGSEVGTSSEQQLLIEEVNVSTVHKEREMQLKKEQAERTEQESCVTSVDTEELSEIGQDMGGAQQHIVANALSLRMLRRSAPCRQTEDRPSYKGGNSDAIMIKRHRRGPTTTPTKTAHKTWTTSISLLQQVKHEIQFWSFSLWVLAPTIPGSFDQHHHRPQLQPQQHNTNSNDGKEIRSQVPCHSQQYGPVEMKHGGLLSTASSSVPCENTDESEYDLILSEETPGLDRHLASSAVVIATKKEDEGKQRRSQDRRNGGNQGPIRELLQSEDQRSFGQLQLHRPSTRTGYMSQSMPDLHAVERTMGPSPVASTLARWSQMALDSERLGSIYQYYLRQRASTLKNERQTNGYGDHDNQGSTTSDDSQDDASNSDDIGNNDDDDDEVDPGMTFVFRSSTLPTVRVGLYSADQKRFWTSSGSIHLSPLSESYD
ncbi:hypothetical protein KI688_009974 [Linnemannia hyalina]|uniref:Uncharacterized protein n=1 Tax=Linnemannia hyalina TaxID=64524 RepID=A0A9P7XXQ3_9FUNG|nr:hypothetical protein KI688_009974 [Linnemannia hyalina]